MYIREIHKRQELKMYGSTNWLEEFARLDALWIHDGNPAHPHALLTSGMHSAGFFNATKVAERPCVLQSACGELSHRINILLQNDVPHVVVGSAFGAITIAHECAKTLNARTMFTQKVRGEMRLERFSIKPGTNVVVVEDVMTTGDTTLKTIKELEELRAFVLPEIGVLVNRSGTKELEGRNIVSLIDHPMPEWKEKNCPLCKAGSKAVRPKEHWEELTKPS